MLERILKPLFTSEATSFEVRNTVEEGARLLRAVVYSLSRAPSTRQALVGRVVDGNVIVRRRRPGVINHFAPVFVGRFIDHDGRTVLSGRFGMSWPTRVFSLAWLGGVLVCVVGAVISSTIAAENPIQGLVHRPIPFVMLALGVGSVCLSSWGYRDDINYMTRDITNALNYDGT